MKTERWQQVNDLFQAATERAPEERAAFLDQACHGDKGLCREVQSLIASYEQAENFIESPAFEVSPELLLADADALIGKHLGHYRIDAVLGVGGMGVVYLACDEKLGRKVGLKLLPQSLIADETQLERLKHEARTASALNHPNIVTIHEIGQVNSTHYIATEFIEGTTLRERMAKGPIPPDEALEIAQQIAGALSVAHVAGIVHCDIKPENIMLRPDGYVKVLDFGIAKFTQQEALTEATSAGVEGTKRYMSPEQARGEALDARTDIWSLGVTLYEMTVGCAPFTGGRGTVPSPISGRHGRRPSSRAAEATPSDLVSARPGLPSEIERVISRALAQDREARYQSAAELRTELQRLQREAGSSGHSRLRIATAVFAAVVLSALVYVKLFPPPPARAPSEIKSVAVLPLENLSADPAQEYFADGMTDALITDLARIGAVRVIARPSVMQYKGARQPLPEIGRALQVDAVLTGSVLRAGERVRIAVQLTHTTTDRSLWADSYERDLRDVLTLQRQVARDVAGEIRIKLTPQEQVRFGSVRPINPDAYDHYLRGQFYLHRQNKEGNEAAITALERAVTTDPNFAEGHAALAQAYVWKLFLFAPNEEQWAEKAFVAAEKALALDPDLAVAYLARGRLLWTPANRFPHEKAIREYRRALELNPSLDEARNQLALVYNHIGAFDEALQELQKAVAINPTNTLAQFRIGQTLLFQNKYEQALTALRSVPQEVNPALVGHQIAWALFNLGRNEEASATLEQLLRDHSEDNGGLFTSVQAVLAAAAGQEGVAEEKIRSAVERGKGFGHFHHTAYHIACAYVQMEQPEEAIKWLESAAEHGFPCYPLFESDPNLHNLRQHVRFATFMAKLRQQWEYYQSIL